MRRRVVWLVALATEPTTEPGSVTFTRTTTAGTLTINYHISGGPTDLNADPATGADHTAEFADGTNTVTVVVHPAIDAEDATVTILEGAGYAVGDPSSGTIEATHFPLTKLCPSTSDTLPATTPNTLARTGARTTSGSLALIGITTLAFGSVLLVLGSRRKATGVR